MNCREHWKSMIVISDNKIEEKRFLMLKRRYLGYGLFIFSFLLLLIGWLLSLLQYNFIKFIGPLFCVTIIAVIVTANLNHYEACPKCGQQFGKSGFNVRSFNFKCLNCNFDLKIKEK